jgi:hypothetical protein
MLCFQAPDRIHVLHDVSWQGIRHTGLMDLFTPESYKCF